MSVSVADLQEIITINESVELVNAVSFFNNTITTGSEMTTAKDHYYNIMHSFNRVRELVEETRDADYGNTSPDGMVEYITDRASEAEAELAKAETSANFSNPNDTAQVKLLTWFEESASGSASASASTSASGV